MLSRAPEITSPVPKTHYVDIPGAHGAMDLTEALTGKVQYKNRKITLEFVTMAGRESWPAIYSEILAELHGQMKEIGLDDDPMHYYTGRVTVGNPEQGKGFIRLNMTAEVAPYKKSIEGVEVL